MELKREPEDFIVREHMLLNLGTGWQSIYLLRKRARNTEDVLQELSRMLKVPRKDIGYCGNKDKQAVTEQHITIKNGPAIVRTPDTFTLTYLGSTSEPLRLGMHERNFFTITVRNADHKPVFLPAKNYFGEQRFGETNVEVGLALLRKDYRRAAELLKLEYTTDPIGALRTIPKHTLLIYVHAVQSQLWNELAATLPTEQKELLLPGFGADNSAYEQLLNHYGLTDDSFVNRSIPELSIEAVPRPVLQDLQHFSASEIKDGVCVLSFSLGKGSYATETVRQLMAGTTSARP